jgi:hypothetical protein
MSVRVGKQDTAELSLHILGTLESVQSVVENVNSADHFIAVRAAIGCDKFANIQASKNVGG